MDASLVQDFITESTEHLEEMESFLLQLESESEQREVLHDIFRCVHTIKGASEFVGLEKIATFSHRLENLLDQLRQGTDRPPTEIVDLLMAARDCMVRLVDELEGNGAAPVDTQDLLNRIDSWTPAAGDSRPEAPQGPEPAYGGEPDTAFLGQDDLPPDLSPAERSGTTAVAAGPAPGTETGPDGAARAADIPNAARLQDEVIDNEENDRELFAIFIEQLTEKIRNVAACARDLETATDRSGVYEACIQELAALRSSANYMGYKALKRFLGEWIDWIERAAEQGRRVAAAEMIGCIDAVLGCFPGLRISEIAEVSHPAEPAGEAAAETAPAPLQSSVDAEPSANANGRTVEERPLEDRLRDAFDLFDAVEAPAVFSDEAAEPEPGAAFPDDAAAVADAGGAPEPADRPGASEDAAGGSGNVPDRETVPIDDELLGPEPEAAAETSAAEARENPQSAPGVAGRKNMRVDAEKIDSLMNQVGELVVNRSYFSQLVHEMRELQQQFKETAALESREMKQIKGLASKMSEATSALGRVVNDLQDGVMKIRMLPIAQLFNRYPRLVRDLVHNTGKKVRLEIKGESTELDKMIIEQMSDPLIHIIRNAVDHGFETVEERLRLGKPAEGRLQLIAYHESNHVVIEIVDDGRGIDPQKIYQAALQREFLGKEELDRMTSKELTGLILRPGFSTAAEITHTSGRGVGMDVVKKNIEKLNGAIEIDSRPGTETRLRIKIPLTLAIISALLVRVGHKPFAIPLTAVEETLRIGLDRIGTVEGFEVIQLRHRTLPLLRLSDMFGIVSAAVDENRGYVVIVSTGMHRIGLLVDTLIGQEEVVIKPLADYIQEDSAFSGATILGDGKVSLILDGEGLVKLAIRKHVMKRTAPFSFPAGGGPYSPEPGVASGVAEAAAP